MPQPFVSIIVPVRNAGRTLAKTFEYLLRVDYPRDRMEIVIADGGSSDDTVKIIKDWQERHPFIKLVEIPNCPSPGFARNKALDVVQGEFLFFTDGDCAPCPGWITEMLKHFQRDPQIGAVGGEIYTLRVDPDNLTELYCENFGFNRVDWRYLNMGENYYPDLSDMSPTEIAGHRAYFFVTANVAYRKEAIDKIGARFWTHPTGEDMEFGLKFRKAGWKFYFAPKASVDHMHRANLKNLNKVWATYGQGHLPLMKEYATNHLEIVFTGHKIKPRIKIPSPIKGFIYIGDFQLMHLFGLTTIIGLIFSWKIFTLASLILGIFFAFRFFYWCWYMKPRKHFFTWCKMKYLTNLHFILGGLKGFWKYKVLCIEPSF